MKTSTLLISTFAFGLMAALPAADVSGKWKSEFDTQIGHLKYTYDLKASDGKITGKALRDQEDGTKVETILVDGKTSGSNEVAFVEPLKLPDQDQELRIEYTGKVNGEEMKLTRKVGEFATTEIVAKLSKEAAAATPSIAGKWEATFESRVGQQHFVWDFKVDGEKLTGKATGDVAGEKVEAEIVEGKIKGAEFSYSQNMKFQDREVKVDYSGKIENDELKMTRKVGENVGGEVVAKRAK